MAVCRCAGLIAVCLALVGTATVGMGCSDQEAERKDSGSFGERVLALQNGDSIDTAKSELGAPQSEFSDGDETTLNYVPWQLRFVDDALKERRRAHRPKGDGLEGSTLDQQVVSTLELGATVGRVKATLGSPDVIEYVYGGMQEANLVLWYGPWELRFRGGRLAFRTTY